MSATNKEKIKKLIFNTIIKNPKFDFTLLGGEFENFHIKRNNAIKEINKLLDFLDIRFLDTIDRSLCKFPKWFVNKNYYIDYNNNGEIDFIINKKICEC